MTRDELIDYLICVSDGILSYSEEELVAMSNKELMDVWLTWIGIIGFGDRIRDVIEGLWGIDLDE